MSRLLPLALLLSLSACQPRQQGSASQPLQAQVLDGGAPLPDGGTAQLDPWDVKGRVFPVQARLGEPFTYELLFTHSKDERFEFLPPKELEQFEVLEQSRQRQDGPNGSVTTFTFKLSAFELGQLTLPPFAFELTAPGGTQTVSVPGLPVEVLGTLPKDADQKGAGLFDFQPPTEVPVGSWRMAIILACVLAVGLLAWGVVKWLNRPRPVVVAVKPLAPLDVRTVLALDNLKAQELPAQGRAKDFYFRLSEIIRGYLGERYGFEALECTTPELFASLRKLPTRGLPEDKLMRFVSESDMVKYAKAEAAQESCAQSLAFAYELVETTFQPPAPAPPTPPAHAPGSRVS